VILDDSNHEGNEELTLAISNATGNVGLQTPTNATVLIINDDPPDTQVVSLNLRSSEGGVSTAPTDSAGVVAALNWNMLIWNSVGPTSVSDLDDAEGAPTTIDASITASSLNNSRRYTGVHPDKRMLLTAKCHSQAAGQWTRCTISDIPAEFVANGYDVYVYLTDQYTSASEGSVALGANTYYITTPADDEAYFDANGYVLSADTNPGDGYDSGNYVLFERQTAASFDVTFTYVSGARQGMAGIQIVMIPKPGGTVILLR
jgi:hypothetical protein